MSTIYAIKQWLFFNTLFSYITCRWLLKLHWNAIMVFSLFLYISARILIFYFIFYLSLAAFFAGLLLLFWTTLEQDRPKYQLDNAIIGTNPGLGFRPMPPEANLGSTLIWYRSNRLDNMKYWYDTLDTYLEGTLCCYLIHSNPLS